MAKHNVSAVFHFTRNGRLIFLLLGRHFTRNAVESSRHFASSSQWFDSSTTRTHTGPLTHSAQLWNGDPAVPGSALQELREAFATSGRLACVPFVAGARTLAEWGGSDAGSSCATCIDTSKSQTTLPPLGQLCFHLLPTNKSRKTAHSVTLPSINCCHPLYYFLVYLQQ